MGYTVMSPFISGVVFCLSFFLPLCFFLSSYLSIISSVLHSYVYLKKFPLESFSFFSKNCLTFLLLFFCSACLLALDYLCLYISANYFTFISLNIFLLVLEFKVMFIFIFSIVFWFTMLLTKMSRHSYLCFLIHNVSFFSSGFLKLFLNIIDFQQFDYCVILYCSLHFFFSLQPLGLLDLWLFSFHQNFQIFFKSLNSFHFSFLSHFPTFLHRKVK